MSGFRMKWLIGWCWAVALFGLILAGGAFEATSRPVRLLFGVLNGPGDLDLNAHIRFSLAVMGAVTIGWSVTLFAAIKAADMLGDRGRPIWTLVTASAIVWYVIDCALSIATGFALNVVPNTILLAAYLIPVLGGGVLRPHPARA